MGIEYVIEQGDYLPAIAERFGFRDYRTVWEASENADLRALRADPTVLLPGDVVVIPEPEPKAESRATAARHTFRVKSSRLALNVRVLDLFGRPLAETEAELEVDGAKETVVTDGEGVLTRAINPSARSISMRVEGETYELLVGHLDPFDTPTGLLARLNNLGYAVGEPGDEVDAIDLAFAVQLFQWDRDLPIDGLVTPALMAAVADVFGV